MADEVKVTKRDKFIAVKSIVENSGAENADELIDFINAQVDAIDARAAKTKERNAAKRAEGDALRDAVAAVLTDELQTADAILGQIDDPDATKGKVVARLTALCKAGTAMKDQVKDGSRKVMGYKLAD